MEPEHSPSKFPEPWRPGIVYFEASVRPSCYRLVNTTTRKQIHSRWETVRTNQTHRAPSWTASTVTKGWSRRNHPTQLQTHADLKRHNGTDPTRMRAISTTWSANASRARSVPMGATVTTHRRGDGHQAKPNVRRTLQTDRTLMTLPQ